MLEEPDNLFGNLRQCASIYLLYQYLNDYSLLGCRMAGETILSITYGIDVLPKDDPYISLAEKAIHPMLVAAVPGTFLVDALPWLKYVPEWMPFAGFKRKAKEWRKLAMDMLEIPYKVGKQKIVSPIVTES